MKRVVRYNVFETNSSSTHSVSIHKNKIYKRPTVEQLEERCIFSINPDDNKLHVPFGCFGWEVKSYISPIDKISYYLTMIYERCVNKYYYNDDNNFPTTYEEFKELPYFIELNDLVAEIFECDGLEVDYEEESYIDPKDKRWQVEGYIDHQSCEEYDNPHAFLDEYGVSLEEFIFSPWVVLHTDNDNR